MSQYVILNATQIKALRVNDTVWYRERGSFCQFAEASIIEKPTDVVLMLKLQQDHGVTIKGSVVRAVQGELFMRVTK